MNIVVFANGVYTNTPTGGDTIFVQIAKQWVADGHSVTVVTNEAGRLFCLTSGLPMRHIVVWPTSRFDRFGVYVSMIAKALLTFGYGLFTRFDRVDIVFASSFFTIDMVPALCIKIAQPKALLSTACYLFTTKRFGSDYSGGKIKGFLFYLNEVFAFSLMKKFGNGLITASDFDRREFIKAQHVPATRVLALRGGVDTEFFRSVPKQKSIYDAVFVGRFHPQKCIDELLDIWKIVVTKHPKRVLALVGTGLQEQYLHDIVDQKKLSAHVRFLGVLEGSEKVKIIKASKLFVSASRFDSGNIALDEALFCGVPGVVYDLRRLSYPKGVIKVVTGDKEAFADAILRLLRYENLRKKMSRQAVEFAQGLDWKLKARHLLTFISKKTLIPFWCSREELNL